jgi:CDP-glycerol glycerophosphotransferase (TagB/SpsB family)
VDLVFVDSESTKDIYKKYYNFPSNRVIVSGYQAYKEVRDLQLEYAKSESKYKETILWLPRWVLSFKDRDKYEGGSTFLNYHYFFYDYAKNNPDIHLIIRPHLLLFSQSVKNNNISQDDLDGIFERFASLSNVTISSHESTSLAMDIVKSDIVVSDGTSALAEVVIANKPIIYLSNGWNNEFNSNLLSKMLKENVLLAYDPGDIKRYLDEIRRDDYRAEPKCMQYWCGIKKAIKSFTCNTLGLKCSREDFIKLLDPVQNPAKFIAEYVLNH